MGFRSTFISEDYHGNLPEWFMDKWRPKGIIVRPNTLMISSAGEMKMYSHGGLAIEDYQKALLEVGFFDEFTIMRIVVMTETGSITRVDLTKDGITFHRAELNEEFDDGSCYDY